MPGSSLCPCTERQVYWYATLPFFTFVLFCFVLFCFVLFCFVLFCFVLFCFVLFCFVYFLFPSSYFLVYFGSFGCQTHSVLALSASKLALFLFLLFSLSSRFLSFLFHPSRLLSFLSIFILLISSLGFSPASVFCTPYPLGLLVASCCLFPRYCVRFIRSLCCFSFLLFFFFFFFFFYFFFFFFPFFFFCSHVVLQRL